MIISEFAGAAQSLNGSIVVNPWDSQQVADAIHQAVTLDDETRAENQRKLFKVCTFNWNDSVTFSDEKRSFFST